jgi:hypothetical protein
VIDIGQAKQYFADKRHSYEVFEVLLQHIKKQGECDMFIASQISFGLKRKFAWIYLYNVTAANPEGIVQIMLALSRKVDAPPVYRATQVGKNRWNHLVVVHSLAEGKDPKLTRLIEEAYRYGAG